MYLNPVQVEKKSGLPKTIMMQLLTKIAKKPLRKVCEVFYYTVKYVAKQLPIGNDNASYIIHD